VAVPTEEWLGVVFARVGGAAGVSLADHLGPLAELAGGAGGFRVAGWREYPVGAGWKDVLAVVPPAAGAGLGRMPEAVGGGWAWGGGAAFGVFPNLLVSAGAGAGAGAVACVTYLLLPRSAGETTVLCDWAFAPGAVPEGDDLVRLVEADDAANRACWTAIEAGGTAAHEPLARMLAARTAGAGGAPVVSA
jgi:hypothetical protein